MPMTDIGGQKVSVDNDHTEATKVGKVAARLEVAKVGKVEP